MAESKGLIWAGRVLSAIPALMLTMSGVMKFVKPTGFDEGIAHLGWAADKMPILGVVQIISVVIYLIPKTAVIGAILITAYLGGATATHVRVGDPYFIPVLLGMAAWGGLFLRDERIRDLIPFTKTN